MNISRTVLIYSANGYNAMEYMLPIARILLEKGMHVVFLQGDYFLANPIKLALDQLSKQYPSLFRFSVIEVMISRWQRQSNMINRLSQLGQYFSLVMVNADYDPLDQYVIRYGRQQGARVIAIQTNVINPLVLERVINKGDYRMDRSSSIKHQLSINTIRLNLLAWYKRLINLKLIPLLLKQKTLTYHPLDVYGFCAGRVDEVIVFDPLDQQALSSLLTIPVRLSHHPLEMNVECLVEKKGILVVLSGYDRELTQTIIEHWVHRIKEISRILNERKIILRFHPRTKSDLKWPKELIRLLNASNCEVIFLDGQESSLVDVLRQVSAVVGAVSGALRSARMVSHGPVIGLLNAAGDSNEQPWLLGKAQGIVFKDIKHNITLHDLEQSRKECRDITPIINWLLPTRKTMDTHHV